MPLLVLVVICQRTFASSCTTSSDDLQDYKDYNKSSQDNFTDYYSDSSRLSIDSGIKVDLTKNLLSIYLESIKYSLHDKNDLSEIYYTLKALDYRLTRTVENTFDVNEAINKINLEIKNTNKQIMASNDIFYHEFNEIHLKEIKLIFNILLSVVLTNVKYLILSKFVQILRHGKDLQDIIDNIENQLEDLEKIIQAQRNKMNEKRIEIYAKKARMSTLNRFLRDKRYIVEEYNQLYGWMNYCEDKLENIEKGKGLDYKGFDKSCKKKMEEVITTWKSNEMKIDKSKCHLIIIANDNFGTHTLYHQENIFELEKIKDYMIDFVKYLIEKIEERVSVVRKNAPKLKCNCLQDSNSIYFKENDLDFFGKMDVINHNGQIILTKCTVNGIKHYKIIDFEQEIAEEDYNKLNDDFASDAESNILLSIDISS